MPDFLTILIVLAVIAIVAGVVLFKHGVTLKDLRADVTAMLAHIRNNDTSAARVTAITNTPAPVVVAQPAPSAIPAAPAAPAAPTAAPTELAPAYIDLADFYKALGAAVAAGYSGGVYLDGKMEHNGFGPFDYYEKSANGNVVRTGRPAAVPPPVPAPTEVAIGSE